MKEGIREDVKEKILNVTVDMIGNYGVHLVTVRKVAKLCQVNVAAINYYFGSKDELIDQAIQYFLKNRVAEIISILDNPDYPIKQKLFLFLKNYMKIISKHPGFPKSILSNVLIGDLYFFKKMNSFLNKIIMKVASLIAEYLHTSDKEIALMKTIQLLAPILLPFTLYDAFSNLFKLDLYNEELIEKYIKSLLEGVLNKSIGG